MEIDLKNLKKHKQIIGCDEVGRGPIAGPVNGCAVAFTEPNAVYDLLELKVTDSKKLTNKKRKLILEALNIDSKKLKLNKRYQVKTKKSFFEFVLCEHTHNEIDEMNILQASLSCMKRASEKLAEKNCKVLIDGNKTFETKYECEAIVKGDAKVIAIGIASIIAKVFRDEKMAAYDELYPGYNLKQHAGYPTKEHRDAVKKLGASPIHRKSFKGVREFL